MKVDFHVHSTASDGTLAPAALAAATADFAAVALTDHDCLDGAASADWRAGAGAARRYAGVELAVRPGVGFNQFHLLGLKVDPDDAGLRGLLVEQRRRREERNLAMAARFRERGIALELEAVAAASGGLVARPHLARWLVEHGYAATITEAFAVYLADDAPAATSCYLECRHVEPAEAIAAIHGAGGLAVMAHPRFLCRAWRSTGCDYAAAARYLSELKAAGLDGLEAVYYRNSAAENVEFSRLADRLGLVKSAGSDFHGEMKPDVPLGVEVSEDFIAPLLERLG